MRANTRVGNHRRGDHRVCGYLLFLNFGLRALAHRLRASASFFLQFLRTLFGAIQAFQHLFFGVFQVKISRQMQVEPIQAKNEH